MADSNLQGMRCSRIALPRLKPFGFGKSTEKMLYGVHCDAFNPLKTLLSQKCAERVVRLLRERVLKGKNAMNKPLTIKEAVQWIHDRTGVRKSYPTLFRWMQKGVGGRRLPFERIGGSFYVSESDLDAFLQACNSGGQTPGQAEAATRPSSCSPCDKRSASRRRQIANNNAELRKKLGMR